MFLNLLIFLYIIYNLHIKFLYNTTKNQSIISKIVKKYYKLKTIKKGIKLY